MNIKLIFLFFVLLYPVCCMAQPCMGREPVFFGGTIKCSDAPYKLVFNDDFDGVTLDTSKWYTYGPVWPDNTDQSLFARTHDMNTTPSTFKELQIYRDENVVVSGGTIKLCAKKEQGLWYGVSKDYTSGYIQAKTPFRYGKLEVRFKLPAGQGFWPAIWLWGNGIDHTGARTMHEIDILEHCGEEPEKHHIAFHYKNLTSNCDATQSPLTLKSVNFTTDFHTVVCEFSPQYIKVFCDDILVRYEPVLRTIQGMNIHCGETVGWGTYLFSNFTPTIYQNLIINLALSSANKSFCDPVNNNTPFPSQMEIDYVKFWQQNIQWEFIDLADFANHLSVYPNPASEVFNIDFTNDFFYSVTQCKIYHSISGNLVVDLPQLNQQNQFNCTGWQKGVYIIYMKLNRGTQPFTKLVSIQ